MKETEVRKPFNELTSVEVNDLIATEIMGWREDPAYSLTWWSGEKREKTRFYGNDMFLDWASDDQPDTSSIFNPYESLDDCYLAEERLLANADAPSIKYKYALCEVVGAGDFEIQFEDSIALVIHATAKQRCHAMLLAKGLCI